jgi:predicted RNA-binding protein with PIN domain
MGLLDKDDFDKKLIGIIKEYNQGKGNEIFLVFDSADYMGDKYSEGNITIIRTPKDDFYKSADDKIVELAQKYAGEELVVVTDDLEIKEKIKNISIELGENIRLEQATDFANKIQNKIKIDSGRKEEKSDLSETDVAEINKDLLKYWK